MIALDEIIVLDNVVSPGYQDMIEQWLLAPVSNWRFSNDIALSDNTINKLGLQAKPGFAKSLFNIKTGASNELYPMILPMVFETFHKANLNFDQVLFSRSFLTMPVPGCGLNDYDHVHVDSADPHMVCLYYANDSDGGDTVFFDHTVPSVIETIEQSKLKLARENQELAGFDLASFLDKEVAKNDWEVIERVTPKKGRAVIFNGLRYHSAARCQSGHRLIVNTCVK